VRKIPERLRDIQEAIARIMKYTREGRYRYDHDELVQTWVTHNLYVIGEAARAIANDFPDFKDQYPEIKWTEIIRYANRPCSQVLRYRPGCAMGSGQSRSSRPEKHH